MLYYKSFSSHNMHVIFESTGLRTRPNHRRKELFEQDILDIPSLPPSLPGPAEAGPEVAGTWRCCCPWGTVGGGCSGRTGPWAAGAAGRGRG